MASKHLPRRAKTKGGLEKCLANPGSRQKITKTTHAVRGLQTKWEIQVQNAADLQFPASNPANAGVRGQFLLGIFPPDHGGNHTPPTPPATPKA